MTVTYDKPPFALGSGIGIGDYGHAFIDNFAIPAPPSVSSLSPGSGDISGGKFVVIHGSEFTTATAFKFGTHFSPLFHIDSATRITALEPKSSTIGPVNVSVTSSYGTSALVAGDKFTYTGCPVPKVKGKKLSKAKKALTNAGCAVGTVTGNKHHKVKKQSPGAGAVLPGGSKVNLKMA